MKPKILTLRPFSAEWWAAYHRDIAAGRSVGFLAGQARRGIGRSIKAADRPCGAAIASLVAVRTDSAEFAEWVAHLALRGLPLPRPDKAPVVWLPSALPPKDVAA